MAACTWHMACKPSDVMNTPANHVRRFTIVCVLLTACTGPAGKDGTNGTNGSDGSDAASTGTIHGVVEDSAGTLIADVAIATNPSSTTATSAADGTFTLANVAIGSYIVTASKDGFTPFALTGVGVAAHGATQVSLLLTAATATTGSITGTVTDSRSVPGPLGGVVVSVEGGTAHAVSAADGSFAITDVPPGPVFLAATAPSTDYLDTETRSAVFVATGSTTSNVKLVLSARPGNEATYVGPQLATFLSDPLSQALRIRLWDVLCHTAPSGGQLSDGCTFESWTDSDVQAALESISGPRRNSANEWQRSGGVRGD